MTKQNLIFCVVSLPENYIAIFKCHENVILDLGPKILKLFQT